MSQKQTNRLADETSPYLLQHAYNPVDWHPWGEEALDKAKAEDKPIFLSVGYSACHWCHVMERESFENEQTAALMNKHFVNIKVDREERPDLDAIYMDAVQTMTGQGGWPMSVFLTPDGQPFYGGTYFPPEPRYGMPSFPQLLRSVAEAYSERRDQIDEQAGRLTQALDRLGNLSAQGGDLSTATLDEALARLKQVFDDEEGGFGSQPKFPQPMTLDFALTQHKRSGDSEALFVAELTLEKMAHGGIYDQLGGGFARYSVDSIWLTPHFEKMLYDNAQLLRTYLHAWQVTGRDLYKRVINETIDYVLREMTSEAGGFYSAQDADSEGVEGKFFVWTPEEIEDVLGEEAARLFNARYGVTPSGNFEGKTILNVFRSVDEVARRFSKTEDEVERSLAESRRKLFTARESRIKPGLDDKVLAEWNGLMIHALAECGAVLGRDDALAAAQKAANFILSEMSQADGKLYRSWSGTPPQPSPGGEGSRWLGGEDQGQIKPGGVANKPSAPPPAGGRLGGGSARFNAYLEDYAAFIRALIALYETTFDLRWLAEASRLARIVIEQFHDEANGGFFQTGRDHETLVVRRKDFVDNAIPSGNSMAAEGLLRLAKLTGNDEYRKLAMQVLLLMQEAMSQQPTGFGRLLGVLDAALASSQEVALVGDPADAATQALLAEVRSRYLPHTVVALKEPEQEAMIPLLAERTLVDGQPAAYVCENFACRLPVTTVEQLGALL